MGDITSLSERRRARAVAGRMDEIHARGAHVPFVDVSDLTLDIDAALAELSKIPGVTVERISPITGPARDNVVPLRPSSEEK